MIVDGRKLRIRVGGWEKIVIFVCGREKILFDQNGCLKIVILWWQFAENRHFMMADGRKSTFYVSGWEKIVLLC